MTRIAILDDYQHVAEASADWSRLPEHAKRTVFHDHLDDQDALVQRLEPFEVIGIMRERTPFPRALLERLPNLRLLVTTGMGNASVDMEAARTLGITVCGTPSGGYATAELAFGLILAFARNLEAEMRSVREGGWQTGLGRDLRGSVLGLVGLGRLGGEMAGFGRAFGMDVIAWSQNLSPERAAEAGARPVTKEALFEEADFVSVHLRLSERTAGLVGAAELGRMKPDACLVNTSRGPIVDEDALVAALEAGRIGGAALDVFEREPLPADDRLLRVPNLMLTPHVGYVTRETYALFYGGMVEAIDAFLRRAPVHVLTR